MMCPSPAYISQSRTLHSHRPLTPLSFSRTVFQPPHLPHAAATIPASLCPLDAPPSLTSPLPFTSLSPSLLCALRPTTTTVPFQIERLTSKDGKKNQANSSEIRQMAQLSWIEAESSGKWRNRVRRWEVTPSL